MVLLAESFPSLRLPEQGVHSCGSVLTYTYLGHSDFQEVFVTGLLTPHVEEVTVLFMCLVKEIQLYLTIGLVPCGPQRC